MQITRFMSLKQPVGWVDDVDLEDFLSQPTLEGIKLGENGSITKSAIPLFSFATFKGNSRKLENVESIEILGFDIDEAPIPDAAQIHAALDALGLFGFWHSSPSAAKNAPRWHLFIPMSRAVDAKTYAEMHKAVRKKLPFKAGSAAVDASRAWFVPARGMVYEYGFTTNDGLIVPEEWKDRVVEAAPGVLASDDSNELPDPSVEAHEKLVDHLVSCWPPVGKRQEAHLALAGALVKLRFSRNYVKQVLHDLTMCTGNDETKAFERMRLVDRTWEKFKTDSPITAWTKLTELLGHIPTSEIHGVLGTNTLGGFDAPVEHADATIGPVRSPQHQYLYTFGRIAAATEMRKVTHSEICSYLNDHPEWKNVLWYNEVTGRIEAYNPPIKLDAENPNLGLSEADSMRITTWMESVGAKIGPQVVYACVESVGKSHPFHPVRNYLDSCPNKVGAIDALSTHGMGIKHEDRLSRAMLRKQLIAAARRMRRPGTKVDSVLVFLTDQQGKKKTSFIETLFGLEYVKSNISDIRSKDAMQELHGMWAIEFGELTSNSSWDLEALKEYLTRRVDIYRPAYTRSMIATPRTCVFFGTTNTPEFLRDDTGNRRFWVIDLNNVTINLDYVRRHRDEIWGEANALAESDEPHWFESTEAEAVDERNADHCVYDAWDEAITKYCIGQKEVRISEIFRVAIHAGDAASLAKLSQVEQKRIARTLRRLGVKQVRRKTGIVWVVSDDFGGEEMARVSQEADNAVKKLLEKANK